MAGAKDNDDGRYAPYMPCKYSIEIRVAPCQLREYGGLTILNCNVLPPCELREDP